jgi:hypothetical protein
MAATDHLKFSSWQRAPLYDLVPTEALTDGRLVGTLLLTLRDGYGPDVATGSVDFHLVAPRDIAALVPRAIIRTVPAALAHEVEATKFVHVDFADPDLPWRYTPRKASGDRLAPWLALLVGTTEELRLDGALVRVLQPGLFAEHDLDQSYRWAHVQEDTLSKIRTSRLLSPRELRPRTEYIATVVPAFDDAGQPAWAAGRIPAALPALHAWRFWTGEAGDFETLALAIMPAKVPGLGRAPVAYRRGAVAADLEMRGAITSLGGPPDGPEVAVVRADVQAFAIAVENLALLDPLGRKVIGLPAHGSRWVENVAATSWATSVNADPRHRGAAGLGLHMGILYQQELLDAAVAQLGALPLAAHLVGQLALGLEAARSLWRRRLPAESARQVHLLAPLMRRMRTSTGTALGAITGPTSPLEAALFSTAARRMLRRGAAWTRHTKRGFVARGELVELANACPPDPEKTLPGLPHVDEMTRVLGLPSLESPDVLDLRPISLALAAAIERLVGMRIDFADPRFGEALRVLNQAIAREAGPCELHLAVLREHRGEMAGRELLVAAVRRCLGTDWTPRRDPPRIEGRDVDLRALRGFLGERLPEPLPSRCRPADLDWVAAVVAEAVDPHVAKPPAWRRVQSRIVGIEITLEPPEVPVGLDFPTWTMLRERAREWLLPGIDQLPKDSVVAMQTNPAFIDAYLAGLNAQLLDELHWRNVPVDRRSTPLLMFWGHVNFESGVREAEIRPFTQWAPQTDLGAKQHQVLHPGDTTGKNDLVVVFRTDLFWRYPATLVYLVKRRSPSPPDPDADLKATPVFDFTAATRADRVFLGPIFQGAIARDLVFFAFDVDPQDLDQYWVVLDEPPSELRFRPKDGLGNPLGGGAAHAAAFAKATIDPKTRVAIDGKYLEQLGLGT